jgi:hypothetical protein
MPCHRAHILFQLRSLVFYEPILGADKMGIQGGGYRRASPPTHLTRLDNQLVRDRAQCAEYSKVGSRGQYVTGVFIGT